DVRAWRVMRGGSFWCPERFCRSAYRVAGGPWFVFGDRGFRVLLSAPPAEADRIEAVRALVGEG
ncbi:MAG: hypothetical protein AAF560_20680, partial [Acidobacteriota bacterium]